MGTSTYYYLQVYIYFCKCSEKGMSDKERLDRMAKTHFDFGNNIYWEDVPEEARPPHFETIMSVNRDPDVEEWFLKFLCFEDANPGSMVPLFQKRARTYLTRDLQKSAAAAFEMEPGGRVLATKLGLFLVQYMPGLVKKNVTGKQVPVYVLPKGFLAMACSELGKKVADVQLQYLGY